MAGCRNRNDYVITAAIVTLTLDTQRRTRYPIEHADTAAAIGITRPVLRFPVPVIIQSRRQFSNGPEFLMAAQ